MEWVVFRRRGVEVLQHVIPMLAVQVDLTPLISAALAEPEGPLGLASAAAAAAATCHWLRLGRMCLLARLEEAAAAGRQATIWRGEQVAQAVV